jgi:hypothetical protein
MAGMQTKELPQFRQSGDLFISHRGANRADSMRILAENGLRPLTPREALARSEVLIAELEERRFYLHGRRLRKSGLLTFSNRGRLAKTNGDETAERKVLVRSGEQQLYMVVFSDAFFAWRFLLGAEYLPSTAASAVVGVKDEGGAVRRLLAAARGARRQ